MKKIISVLLCAIMIFSASGFTVFAKDYKFITVDKDFGEVSFDADFAEVGVPLTVKVPGSESKKLIYRWYVDGTRIDNDSASYTPLDCDMQSMISVEVFDTKGNALGSANMFLSDLPVIYIETENRQPIVSKENYLDAEIRIQGNKEYSSEKFLYEGKTEIRGRGNSTWNTDKKPYRLKLDSKADLFGMGKSKHWVLLSNPFDTSLLRNHISYNLAEDMGLSNQKLVWVDLVLNGKVVGNYQLCEHVRVDENRVEITNWEDLSEDAAKAIYNANKSTMTKDERDKLIDLMAEDMSWTTSDEVVFKGVTYTVSDYIDVPDINGGYLIEVVKNVDEYTFKTKNGVCVSVDTPEVLSEDMLNAIQGYYQAFEDALFSEDFCTTYNGETMRYTDFIDLESFVKGLLLNEIFENFDFGLTSTWMSKDVDGKLVYGPVWDMDNTLMSATSFKWRSLNFKWLQRLLSDPVFLAELRKTYFDYRYTAIYDLIKDGGDIDSALSIIKASAKRNDYIWKNEIGYEENARDLKYRLQSKIAWLDSVLADMPSAYNSMANTITNMEYVNSDSLSLKFNKDQNSLGLEFNGTLPKVVKIFAGGKLCGTLKPINNTEEFMLPKIREGSVITAVCYDENLNILFGSYCLNERTIIKLFVSSHIPKFTYDAGEPLGLEDIELTARYDDGTEEKVKPQLAYTYVKDAIGEQFFSYDKVTEEIGTTFIVLRYGSALKEYEIQVNARENYKDVISMIKKLPKKSDGNHFVGDIFEAQVAYDALSETAKAKVKNLSKLSSLMTDFNSHTSDTSGVVACVVDGIFRTNARSTILVVSKGTPNKIILSHPDGSTTTYAKNSAAYLSEKCVGDYTVSTIRHIFPNDSNYKFGIRPLYSDSHMTDPFEIVVSDLANEAKAINNIFYSSWVNEDDVFKIEIDKDSEVNFFALYENGNIVKLKVKDNNNVTTLMPILETPGKHIFSLYYSYSNSSIEYGNIEVFVREFKDQTNRIISIDYPAESYKETVRVDISTSADVQKLDLVCGETAIDMVAEPVEDMKFWTAEIDITDNKEYTLHMNSQPTLTVISPKYIDPFVIEGTKLVRYLDSTGTAEIPASITEIADGAFDGFEGKILCYPNSPAEKYAKENGIDYESFEIKANLSKINIDSGESIEIEVQAKPYFPKDFNLEYDFDESVISFDGKTVAALKPGYTRLDLYSDNGLYKETIYVSVGGGPRKGDINADEKINSMDALLILQHNVKQITLTEEQQKAANISGDKAINSMDALIVLQIATAQRSIWDYI